MTLKYTHYDVEEIPALEVELTALITRLEQQRTLVADLPADNKTKAITETSILLELERKVEKLKEKLQLTKNVAFNRNLFQKFDSITDKNNCLRVRFYDWLASKLEHLAARIRNHATNISKPCVVKIPKQKKDWKVLRKKEISIMLTKQAKDKEVINTHLNMLGREK